MTPHNLANFDNNSPIGVFDSGLGGLTVLRELKKRLPGESFVYLGDTARAPYGSKGARTIARYARDCIRFLTGKKVKLIVAACNTVSALGEGRLNEESVSPVIGTIPSAVREVSKMSACTQLGVIGTEATIASRAYEQAFLAAMPELHVTSIACPLFVPLVEQGMLAGEVPEAVIKYYLESSKNNQIDALVLACTHYPLLKESLGLYMGSNVEIIEPSKSVAELVEEYLEGKALLNNQKSIPKIEYFVTDDVSRFDYLAKHFLQNEEVNSLKVEEL